MTSPARTAPHPPTTSRPPATAQGITTDEALAEITRLAGFLCEHLTDRPWRTAAAIRHLAETLNAHQPRTT
ncbi:hypothetical protein [Streptomyces sp. NPDC049555]|uniref:hypothetical protein n=1 Tax=Streptomyces sp. NPDC049555 TaxID=3154930 RepID=UPI00341D26CC